MRAYPAPRIIPWVASTAPVAYGTASRTRAVTFSKPAGKNDVVILFCYSTTTATITIPSPWINPLGGTVDVESDSHQACVIYQKVTAEASTFTATNLYDATEVGGVIGVLLRGVAFKVGGGTWATGFSSTNTATPHVIPTITQSYPHSIRLGFVCSDGTETYTTPSGWTLLGSTTTTQGAAVYVKNTPPAVGSADGTVNVTPSAGNEYIGMTCCFPPMLRPFIGKHDPTPMIHHYYV